MAKVDPFYEELKRHGQRPERPFDNALRDRVRKNAKDCAPCRALIEAHDLALMNAFFARTRPFARPEDNHDD
jgi:hypothetical protein